MSAFQAHPQKDGVESHAWNPSDRNQLATCSVDKVLKVWDVRSPNRPAQEYKTGGEGNTVKYSPDGHYVGVGATQREKNVEVDILGIYDVRAKKKHKSVKLGFVNDFAWSPNMEYMLCAHQTGSIDTYICTAKLQRVRTARNAHTAACRALEVDPLNRYLASGGNDGLVGLWDLEDFVCVRTIEYEAEVRTLSFSADGRFLATAVSGHPTEIAEVETGSPVLKLPEKLSTARFHPKIPLLAGAIIRPPTRGDFGLRLYSLS